MSDLREREREREREGGREGGREGEKERMCVYSLPKIFYECIPSPFPILVVTVFKWAIVLTSSFRVKYLTNDQ